MLATKQGQQTFAARESTKVCRLRVGLVREAFILMSRRRGITKCPKACMGVPGAVANERGERRSSCFWALQIGCAGRVPHHSKSCVGVCGQGDSDGDVAVVEANGDRSSFLLSPRRICLRLIIHGSTDHCFDCGVGAVD